MVSARFSTAIFAITLAGQAVASPNNWGAVTITSSASAASTTVQPTPPPTCYALVTPTAGSTTTSANVTQTLKKRENWGKATSAAQPVTVTFAMPTAEASYVVVNVTATPTGTNVLWCTSIPTSTTVAVNSTTTSTSQVNSTSTKLDNSTNEALGQQNDKTGDKNAAGKATTGILVASAMSLFAGIVSFL